MGTILALTLLSAPVARADFTAKLVDVTPDNPYATVNVSNIDTNNRFSYSGAIAGQINWQANTSVVGLTTGGLNSFGTFCIEIPRNVYIGSTYNFSPQDIAALPTSRNPTMGDVKAAQIEALWAAWRGTLDTGSPAQVALNYAAFQVAIWEIDYENSTTYSLASGNFKATDSTPGVVGLANTFLATIQGYDQLVNGQLQNSSGQVLARANLVGFKLTDSHGGDAQDQIAEVKPVPAPPGLVLALIGFLPCVGVRRLRNRLLGS